MLVDLDLLISLEFEHTLAHSSSFQLIVKDIKNVYSFDGLIDVGIMFHLETV